MSERIIQPTIPEPYQDVKSLRATAMGLKEAVEILMGQRGDGTERAVTYADVTNRGWDQVGPLRMNSIVINVAGSYSYTRPVGLKYLQVELWGAGGGVSGCPATAAGQMGAGGGGGGGGYVKRLYKASDLGATENFTVGAAGAAGTSTTAGGNGGASTFKGMSAGGGTGGPLATVGTAFATSNRGTGGTASGGDVNLVGGDGQPGMRIIHGTTTVSITGAGGVPANGAGAATTFAFTGTWAATAGRSPGGGATGAGLGPSLSAISGAAGAAGMAVLTEFY